MTNQTDSRALRTRNALLTAGFEVMADRAIDSVSIDELVSTAKVGKGSFFNHFNDKDGFKTAIALEVRAEIEAKIESANEGVENALERLAGGMREVTDYALEERKRTIAMLRVSVGASAKGHPLNKGVRADFDACVRDRVIKSEATDAGVLYWLGLCVAIITNVVELNLSRAEASKLLGEILYLGLIGLGSCEDTAMRVADECSVALMGRSN